MGGLFSFARHDREHFSEYGFTVSYKGYIAWSRLTHNGHRKRDQMSPADQAEYDAFGLGPESEAGLEHEEAKRA